MDRSELNRLLAGGKYERGLVKREIKVVLCKPIDPSPTVTIGGANVVLTPSRPIGYVILGPPGSGDKARQLPSGVRTADDQTEFPKNALIFRIPTTEDRKAFLISPLSKARTPGQETFATWFEMETVGDGSGLVQMRPYKEQIRNVPEKDYEKVLRLKEEQILADGMSSMSDTGGPWFAFRRGDAHYGWFQVHIACRNDTATVSVVMCFQKDGSRYVPKPKRW